LFSWTVKPTRVVFPDSSQTITFEQFIGASKVGDKIIGHVKILKKTKTLVFLFCELKCNEKIITSASGVWKILKVNPSDLGPGG